MSTPLRRAMRPAPPVAADSHTGSERDGPKWTRQRVARGVAARIARVRDALVLPVVVRSEWLSSFYYVALSGAFRREHRAVLLGRRRYAAQNHSFAQHDYLLRRNVHMLGKGLSMRPRRPVFALDYILPTVRCFRSMASLSLEAPDLVDADQLRWAHDVLTAYFQVAGEHPRVAKARTLFGASAYPVSDALQAAAPYARDLSAPPPVGYEDLLELALRRRSVRWYLPKAVERQKIDAALEVAALSPSACNRQPFEFMVFDEPGDLARVSAIPPGTRGFGHNFPAFVVIVGRLRAFFSERDRHLIYIDGALAAMSFVLALESLGLASCCINWADSPEQERTMADFLGLAADERVVMCISLGYADPEGLVPYSEKRPLDLIRRYGRPT
jgi:nitroreductase